MDSSSSSSSSVYLIDGTEEEGEVSISTSSSSSSSSSSSNDLMEIEERVDITKKQTSSPHASSSSSSSIQLVYNNNVYASIHDDTKNCNDIKQDPYHLRNWLTKSDIAYNTKFRYGLDRLQQASIMRKFLECYMVIDEKNATEITSSSTKPLIYKIQLTKDYAQALSLDYNREELIMKLIPLYNPDTFEPLQEKQELDEIYHEIVIAYYLNQLVYGYEHLLCIHFMALFDWFIIRKESLLQPNSIIGNHSRSGSKGKFRRGSANQMYHQAIILEKADISLNDYLMQNPSVKVIKAILFEIFDSLEIAWYTHRYIHHDLHLKNIMMKNVNHLPSLRNKHLYYKRLVINKQYNSDDGEYEGEYEEALWYKVDKDHIKNHIVKIIDFGRNRMYIPSNESKPQIHDKLITLSSLYEHVGYSNWSRVNRQIDVYKLILSILRLDDSFWFKFAVENDEKDIDSFFQFCDEIIPYNEINGLISNSNNNALRFERRLHSHNEQLRSAQLIACPKILNYLFTPGVFIYKHHPNHKTTVTTALNHSFFDEYKQQTDNRLTTPYHVNDGSSIVVSFPLSLNEIDMDPGEGKDNNNDDDEKKNESNFKSLLNSSRYYLPSVKCDVCYREGVNFVVFNENDKNNHTLLCSSICYEFKFVHGSKTVLDIQ